MNTFRPIKYVLVIFTAVLLIGCAPAYYLEPDNHPVKHHNPKQKVKQHTVVTHVYQYRLRKPPSDSRYQRRDNKKNHPKKNNYRWWLESSHERRTKLNQHRASPKKRDKHQPVRTSRKDRDHNRGRRVSHQGQRGKNPRSALSRKDRARDHDWHRDLQKWGRHW